MSEEILLDVYTHAWRRAEDYDSAGGEPLSWLMSIARARAIDCLRSRKPDLASAEKVNSASGERMLSTDETEPAYLADRRKLVRSALEALPSEQLQVIDLIYYGGLSYNETAARLQQTPAVVRARARLGMIRLSALLRPLFEGRA
jgi:RNA polymerase sigma-70 factor (ECF subfamily)